MMRTHSNEAYKIIIVGGGAAGFFAAINAAEMAREKGLSVDISILEFSSQVLKKVKISGGGRCNVTHHLFEPRLFCERYPRGAKELRSSFEKFQARDTVEWFRQRGVDLVPEDDGRMFPSSNTSETIIHCFLDLSKNLGIQIHFNHRVQEIVSIAGGQFHVVVEGQDPQICDAVMIATGSSPQGHHLAKKLGHTITELAPSLFSFVIEDELIADLSGLSFPQAMVELEIIGAKNFKEQGPLLITHWGLSGPAVLKISAWAAREMKAANYSAKLSVNWMGVKTREDILKQLLHFKTDHAKVQIQNIYPSVLAKRFWLKVLECANVTHDKKYADVSKQELLRICDILFSKIFLVKGKNRYKDEFVECGGVFLKEVDFKTMESKRHPGLYFSGEVLDIDGITGGFNFQNAWTGSWIAAKAMVESRLRD